MKLRVAIAAACLLAAAPQIAAASRRITPGI